METRHQQFVVKRICFRLLACVAIDVLLSANGNDFIACNRDRSGFRVVGKTGKYGITCKY